MEEVIAVEVKVRGGGSAYFMTWGRLWGVNGQQEIEMAVERACPKFGVDPVEGSSTVCRYLSVAKESPLFFEAMLEFAEKVARQPDDYPAWAEEARRSVMMGKEIYSLGIVGPAEQS